MKLKFKDPGPKLRFERPTTEWRPEPLPQLHAGEPISADFEYKPNDNPTKIEPIGYSIYRPSERKGYYVPFGHEGGGNVDRDGAVRWLKNELPGRDVYGLATKFEVHCARNLGVDADLTRWHDVAFNATLLNENRYDGFSLESLAEEYLPADERKIHPTTVDPGDFWLAHASEVAERCVSDSYLAWRIHEVTRPIIEREDLGRVLALEDRVILPVVEMERNGCRIDRGKLERWISEVDNRIEQRTIAVSTLLGTRALNADKPSDLDLAFARLGLEKPVAWDDEYQEYTPSWSGLDTVDHPVARDLQQIRRLKSIRSKYLSKYLAALDENNILRYNLHQLRSDNDSTSPNHGTVTGRFSSGGGALGINIQQVFKAKKQIAKMGPDFLIRELIIAVDGLDVGASDAAQIEFRLFASYANDPTLTEAYAADPRIDFYKQVAAIAEVERDHAKVISLAKLYAMGIDKLARSLGLECRCGVGFRCDCDLPNNGYQHGCGRAAYRHADGCPAIRAIEVNAQYDLKFPAARKLSKAAVKTAETRGYVHTILGRRRRYPTKQRLHSAFNAVIQGGAADIFKTKLVELYDARDDLGIILRAPVHDENVYDIVRDDRSKRRLQDLLDFQSFPLRVPILWESGFGANWKEANEDKSFMKEYLT